MLRILYIVFVAVLLATFIGVGIEAFYPSPKPPSYTGPVALPPAATQDASTSAQYTQYLKETQAKADAQNEYMQQMFVYNKNVSIISVAASIIILILSLTLVKNIEVMSDGTMLGSVITLIYSIIRGFGSQDEKFRFIVVTIGLVIAIFLGYIKFIKPASVQTSSRRKK